jgi:hypothetical protein
VDLSQKSDAEILSIANPIMDNLMDASSVIDYDRHSLGFTDRLKGVLWKERLERICQDYQKTRGTCRAVAESER